MRLFRPLFRPLTTAVVSIQDLLAIKKTRKHLQVKKKRFLRFPLKLEPGQVIDENVIMTDVNASDLTANSEDVLMADVDGTNLTENAAVLHVAEEVSSTTAANDVDELAEKVARWSVQESSSPTTSRDELGELIEDYSRWSVAEPCSHEPAREDLDRLATRFAEIDTAARAAGQGWPRRCTIFRSLRDQVAVFEAVITQNSEKAATVRREAECFARFEENAPNELDELAIKFARCRASERAAGQGAQYRSARLYAFGYQVTLFEAAVTGNTAKADVVRQEAERSARYEDAILGKRAEMATSCRCRRPAGDDTGSRTALKPGNAATEMDELARKFARIRTKARAGVPRRRMRLPALGHQIALYEAVITGNREKAATLVQESEQAALFEDVMRGKRGNVAPLRRRRSTAGNIENACSLDGMTRNQPVQEVQRPNGITRGSSESQGVPTRVMPLRSLRDSFEKFEKAVTSLIQGWHAFLTGLGCRFSCAWLSSRQRLRARPGARPAK